MARESPRSEEEMILDAALSLRPKGFQDATISEISKAAGVAAVYEYFKSKEDLLFSILRGSPESTEVTEGLSFVRTARQAQGHRAELHRDLKNPEYASLIVLHGFCWRASWKDRTESSSGHRPFLVRATLLGAIEHLATRKHLLGTRRTS